jgi:FtsP/CotA-like multicopper oxidase with cupredoxin domain
MGRFGNVFLTNGETNPSLTVRRGEVVRFYLTNTANTRVFNVGVPGAPMKLIGCDSGRYERERFVQSVLIAPSERAVVDVFFDQPGPLTIEHRTPDRTYPVATVIVEAERREPSLALEFGSLRTNSDMVAERERLASRLNTEPDKTLALVAEMDMDEPELPSGTAVAYVCPMHPDVIAEKSGRCPKCGMKLVQAPQPSAAAEKHHDMQGGGESEHHHNHASPARAIESGGIEWEDEMVELNRRTTAGNMRWKIIDRANGAEGRAIDWRLRVGDRLKIRLVNEMESDHPMHHPFHIHGAGRFLILSRDGVVEPNLVWKDTVLVPTGQTVDILLDVTNPGVWMAHCHIAEHHESGMMFSFDVVP